MSARATALDGFYASAEKLAMVPGAGRQGDSQYEDPVSKVESAANWSSVNLVESSCQVS